MTAHTMSALLSSAAAQSPLKDRLICTAWASPYLLFMAIPMASAVHTEKPAVIVGAAVWLALYTLIYLSSWVRCDTAPLSRRWDRYALAVVAVLFVSSLVTALVSGDVDVLCSFSYTVAIVILQSPRNKLLVSYLVLIIAICSGSAVLVLLHQSGWEQMQPLIWSVVTTSFVTWLIRSFLGMQQAMKIEVRQATQLERHAERERLSSQLHDVLGQTLTAINVHAQLAGRQLEKDQVAPATQTLAQLENLSSQALADMRQVIAATRESDLDQELASASALMEAAGITVEIDEQARPQLGKATVLAAEVLREASANVVHHAQASRVWITLDAYEVSLRDNGVGTKNTGGKNSSAPVPPASGPAMRALLTGGAPHRRQGMGLENLERRVTQSGVGRLYYGPTSEGGWQVRLEIYSHPGGAESDLSKVTDTGKRSTRDSL